MTLTPASCADSTIGAAPSASSDWQIRTSIPSFRRFSHCEICLFASLFATCSFRVMSFFEQYSSNILISRFQRSSVVFPMDNPIVIPLLPSTPPPPALPELPDTLPPFFPQAASDPAASARIIVIATIFPLCLLIFSSFAQITAVRIHTMHNNPLSYVLHLCISNI